MARANPYPTNTSRGGSDLRNHQVASRLLINCRTIYNIHNIVNANISLVLHVNKHIVRQKANNGTKAVVYVILVVQTGIIYFNIIAQLNIIVRLRLASVRLRLASVRLRSEDTNSSGNLVRGGRNNNSNVTEQLKIFRAPRHMKGR